MARLGYRTVQVKAEPLDESPPAPPAAPASSAAAQQPPSSSSDGPPLPSRPRTAHPSIPAYMTIRRVGVGEAEQAIALRAMEQQGRSDPIAVPEDLIAQAQVVLTETPREVIIRELQSTRLDVNQAVNNILTHGGGAEEGRKLYFVLIHFFFLFRH